MPSIKPLPEALRRLLSAGEVVEGPHSVVKELVDNSIDAFSYSITLKISRGGLEKIIVEDDGVGMDENDLKVCFMPGYTSKVDLTDVSSIFHPPTLGFRGEALYAISAVSRLRIESSPFSEGSSAKAHRVVVESGRLIRFEPAPPRKGTRVEVERLFYNVPVRLKNWSPHKGSRKVREVFLHYAPFYENISWEYYEDGSRIYSVKSTRDTSNKCRDRITRSRLEKLFQSEVDVISILRGNLGVNIYFVKSPEGFYRRGYNLISRINGRVATSKELDSLLVSFLKRTGHGEGLYYVDFFLEKVWVDHNVHPGKVLVSVSREGFSFLEDLLEKEAHNFIAVGDSAVLSSEISETPSRMYKIEESAGLAESLSLYEVSPKIRRPGRRSSSRFLGVLPGNVFLFRTPSGVLFVRQDVVALSVLLKSDSFVAVPAGLEVPSNEHLLSFLMDSNIVFEVKADDTILFREIPYSVSEDLFLHLVKDFPRRGKAASVPKELSDHVVRVLEDSPEWLDEILGKILNLPCGFKFLQHGTYFSWLL